MKSLKGHEIMNMGFGPSSFDKMPAEYQNYHQPRENESIHRSQRDNDPLLTGGSYPVNLGMMNR